jgi:hypothetical protein
VSAVSAELAAFLDEPLLAVVGTRRGDGRIALNPVWFAYGDGCISLNSYNSALWPKRVQRQRGAALLLIDPHDPLRTAQIDGELVSVRREGARAHIDALSQRYLGHPYRGPHGERLILTLRAARIRSPLGRLG